MDSKTMPFYPNPPQDRGAGGKSKKSSSRRQATTPYDRPQQNQEQRRRWISKLVDPAFRLVYGGANLIFPSLFSKSRSDNALPSPSTLEENHEVDEQYDVADDGNLTENNVISSTTQLAGSSSNLDVNEKEHNQKAQVPDPDGISEIEQLVKDKEFSRDDINRLLEIINSKIDHSDMDQENAHGITRVGYLGGSGAVDYSGKSTERKQEDVGTSKNKDKIYSPANLLDTGKPIPIENSIKSTKEKNEDLDRILWRSSTPILHSKARDDIGSSPIDIARAYMEKRASEMGIDTNSSLPRDEETFTHINELVAKPSPVPRTIPCWPGALVQEQNDYMTPQTQRKRFGLQNFPRTPYSRSIHSRVNSRLLQLQGNSDRHPSITATTQFQQTLTPSGQVNSKNNASYGGHGSVGPIRRVRQKVNAETPSRVSVNFKTPLSSAEMEYFSKSEGLFSAPKKNLENGQIDSSTKYLSFGSKPQNTEVSAPSVPSHSSQVARKILEHLDRNPPTPKEKSAELRLASSWNKSQQVTSQPTFISNKLNGMSNLGGLDSPKSVQGDKDNPQESANKANAVVSNNATALTHGDGPSQDFSKALHSQYRGGGEYVAKVSSRLPPRTSSAKPVLSSITIGKPIQRWPMASSSDNSSGFSFPVSAASGGSSEPPTPTMPTFSAVGQNEGLSVPSFSFGSRKSTTPLVFSFPSTSSSFGLEDGSGLEFKFGSDEPRISFASVCQKDTICY